MSEQGRPGRYQRSFGGLVGALVITVLVVLAFVIYRGIFSDDVEQTRPPAIDYLDAVESLQQNGQPIVYPETLPAGWYVSDLRPELGERPSFEINLYTDDGRFVGVRQADVDVEDLVEEYIDENAAADDPLDVDGTVSTTWAGWKDDGGDHGFSTRVGEQSVLVYGDVPASELTELVPLLTTDPVATSATPGSSPS